MNSSGVFRSIPYLLLVISIVGIIGCADTKDPRLDFLVETEAVPYDGVPIADERIEELREEIARYEKEIDAVVTNYAEVASFQKLLAHELIQREMYGPAYEAVRAALAIQPENAVLYYFGGVAAARSARAQILQGEETDRLEHAERLFRQALDLRPEYKDALFAMAVLLAFDLDRPEEAVEYSRRLSTLETGDPSVKFLHANVLVRNGAVEEAIEVYDELAQTAPSNEQRRQARENREELVRRGGSP